jgi:hypothetical protein
VLIQQNDVGMWCGNNLCSHVAIQPIWCKQDT